MDVPSLVVEIKPYTAGLIVFLSTELELSSNPRWRRANRLWQDGDSVLAYFQAGHDTLVIVQRQQLLDQWRERLAMFLESPIGEIGQIGGSKTQRKRIIDVAIVQSLYQDRAVKDFVANHGQVLSR